MAGIIYSPSWKKPSDVMKRLKRKSRALSARMNQTAPSQETKKKNGKSRTITECHNPFRKRLRLENDTGVRNTGTDFLQYDWSCDTTLFNLLQPKQDSRYNSFMEKSEEHNVPQKSESEKWFEKPPVDWSLKTKLRLLSLQPFSWNMNALKTTAEASGTTGFVRCLHSSGDSLNESLDTTPSAQVHQRRLVWIHPSLPWLNLYPRMNRKIRKPVLNLNGPAQQALYIDWCESLRSLFHLLRSRQCGYFYVCCSTFTVLFRAAGIAGIAEEHALITPTSKGLREALNDEGIEFTMPLKKETKDAAQESIDEPDSSSPNLNVGTELTEDKNCNDDDDDFSSWMTSVGLEQDFLDSTNLMTNIRKETKHDHRPESLVYVQGVDVQALFNFLLNSNTCVSTTGDLAGIPPTLLAPVAFQSATLKPLKVKQNVVQVRKTTYYNLEFEGPILPHVMHNLMQLFSTGTYSMTSETLENTVAFSLTPHSSSPFVPSAFAQQSLADCGLHPDILKLLCSETTNCIVRELHAEKGLFKWR